MKFNPEIHQRKSIRLKEFDYSQAGYYFVTICTKDKQCLFGYIQNGKIVLNELGHIVEDWLDKIPEHFQDVSIDYYCLMPNHIHLIIIIDENCRGGVTPPQNEITQKRGEETSPLRPTLGKIIAYFKYQSAKQINQIRNTPGFSVWQRNYYEHIIRNEKALYSIRKYIEFNTLNWLEDEYYI